MFVALDREGNRLYANSGECYTECYCPVCNELVQQKTGKIRRPHFAHRPNSECWFGNDKDYKSEWHIRMQEYFPEECREVRFVDGQTDEVHIADVYLQDSNTVIEFQHSPITEEEFLSRTTFHLYNGRRIVWLFDESTTSENRKYGKFSEDDCQWEDWPYTDNSFKWLRNPRRFLCKGPNIKRYCRIYSVCVYTGTEGDLFHRIVNEHCDFEYVTFSLQDIIMNENLNVEVFFNPTEIEQRTAQKESQRLYQLQSIHYSLLRKPYRRKRRF